MGENDFFRDWSDWLKFPDLGEFNLSGSTETLRRSFYRASRSIETDLPSLAEISNLIIDGEDGPLAGRLYVPKGAGIAPAPGMVFFHGGGFVLGDLDSHDVVCRRLADGAKCRVLSVDYRLAPEHKFPTAHADALAAWTWAIERSSLLGFDSERIAVAGDSAGGNLAAFICQEANRSGLLMPAFQLLLYPLVQFADLRTKKLSFQEGGFFISSALFDYFRDSYLASDTERMDPRVSPLFAKADTFQGLPPAHLVLCGWDPLKHEGQAYADKLAAHGVPVSLREHPGMVHGFMNLTGLSMPARDAIFAAGRVVGEALGSRSSG